MSRRMSRKISRKISKKNLQEKSPRNVSKSVVKWSTIIIKISKMYINNFYYI